MPLMLFDVSCYVCKMEEIIETFKSVYFSPGPLISVVGNILYILVYSWSYLLMI